MSQLITIIMFVGIWWKDINWYILFWLNTKKCLKESETQSNLFYRLLLFCYSYTGVFWWWVWSWHSRVGGKGVVWRRVTHASYWEPWDRILIYTIIEVVSILSWTNDIARRFRYLVFCCGLRSSIWSFIIMISSRGKGDANNPVSQVRNCTDTVQAELGGEPPLCLVSLGVYCSKSMSFQDFSCIFIGQNFVDFLFWRV